MGKRGEGRGGEERGGEGKGGEGKGTERKARERERERLHMQVGLQASHQLNPALEQLKSTFSLIQA
jgi:hypothetical protein